MPNIFRAVFRDDKGAATYSARVELRDGAWVMETSDGFQPITFYFDDDDAGRLTFSHYREEPGPTDQRLHISRMPGESSFAAMQRAYAEREIVEQRKQRQAARAEIQNALPDPAKIQQARDLNNQYGALRNRHGIKNQ
jgi:hypothetical protein